MPVSYAPPLAWCEGEDHGPADQALRGPADRIGAVQRSRVKPAEVSRQVADQPDDDHQHVRRSQHARHGESPARFLEAAQVAEVHEQDQAQRDFARAAHCWHAEDGAAAETGPPPATMVADVGHPHGRCRPKFSRATTRTKPPWPDGHGHLGATRQHDDQQHDQVMGRSSETTRPARPRAPARSGFPRCRRRRRTSCSATVRRVRAGWTAAVPRSGSRSGGISKGGLVNTRRVWRPALCRSRPTGFSRGH